MGHAHPPLPLKKRDYPGGVAGDHPMSKPQLIALAMKRLPRLGSALDDQPQFGEGREENHKAHADKLLVRVSPRPKGTRA
jgi:hypothetical protein